MTGGLFSACAKKVPTRFLTVATVLCAEFMGVEVGSSSLRKVGECYQKVTIGSVYDLASVFRFNRAILENRKYNIKVMKFLRMMKL